jgi:hypothetical protein
MYGPQREGDEGDAGSLVGEMTDDDPITLADACRMAGRGRLRIFKVGRRIYTTPAATRDGQAMPRKQNRRTDLIR